jgi:uncharacterized membrane protein YfcA
VIVPTAIIGTWRNRRNLNLDVRAAVIIGVSGAATAVAGGIVADRMHDHVSNALFALLLVYMALRLVRETRAE